MSLKSAVILLRAPSEVNDKYDTAFSTSGYTALSVPVLETVLVNIVGLTNIVQNGAEYDGVIVTSARACEAWRDVVDNLGSLSTTTGDDWNSKPFYVVGKATKTALSEIYTRHPESPFAPTPSLIKGEDCGNADQLGHFIVDDVKSRPVKLLYLTGDKNRDTLPNILRDGDVGFQALQVYETRGSTKFPTDLKDNLDPCATRWWIVFFAPSAAQFVLPFIEEYFELPGKTSAARSSKPLVKVASIGPTTDKYLRETLNLHVAAMASKPTPEDLVSAIISSDTEHD
ncbi:tetrapyrrole biosynthesis, uroporphyrinogen III synthase [Marasmius fiardii PR-910]|nr:tetrapyrrole biosynthesis, uroporphyrinogen III synthase [Marasmius fiardii PR-910]